MNNQNYEELYTLDTGLLIAVSGPSGAGKSAVCVDYTNENSDNTILSISETTRAPRGNEVNGKEYYFIDRQTYEERRNSDYYLETAEVHSEYYGTPKEKILSYLKSGKDVILEIDYQGADKVKKQIPSLVKVFVLPSSFEALEKQIRGRGTESEEKIQKRLKNAREEIAQVPTYDYVIINRNGKLDESVADLAAIIRAERLNVKRILEDKKGE